MFKFVFSAVFCAALCLPGTLFAQDCGCCQPAPRKRLKIEQVDRQVSRFERQCVTDNCGCTRSKLGRVCKTVQRPKLTTVEVPADPCGRTGLLSRLRGRVGASNGGCCEAAAPAPEPCGCAAAPEPAPCGCDAAPEIMYGAAPAIETAAPAIEAAAPCCGG